MSPETNQNQVEPSGEGSHVKLVPAAEQYDDEVDGSVYKRDQKSKWRSRSDDKGGRVDFKRQKKERQFKVT